MLNETEARSLVFGRNYRESFKPNSIINTDITVIENSVLYKASIKIGPRKGITLVYNNKELSFSEESWVKVFNYCYNHKDILIYYSANKLIDYLSQTQKQADKYKRLHHAKQSVITNINDVLNNYPELLL
jgi:hypothetical protein